MGVRIITATPIHVLPHQGRAASPPVSAPLGPAGPHPVIPAVGSALLLWSAFPPTGWHWLAWIAVAPLFHLIYSRRSRAAIYVGSWVGGMVFWMLAISWIRLTDESAWLAWVVMAFVLSLWWPGFIALGRWAVLRLKLPLMVAAPVLWVGLEYIRAYTLTGFPWYYLAHTQHQVLPVIQIADFSGALGLSWLMALVNAWCVDLVSLPLLRPTPKGARLTPPQARRLATMVVLVTATLAYGALRLDSAKFRPGPCVALLQSSMLQSIKMKGKAQENEARFIGLIDKAVRSAEPVPELIVWPETSFPYLFGTIDPKLDIATFERFVEAIDPGMKPDDYRHNMELNRRHIHGLTDQLGIPMLVGTIVHEFHPNGHFRYNGSVLFQPGVDTIQSYYKIHLVPFGEYVPLIKTFPWLTALTPYHGTHVPTLDFGSEPTVLDLGPYRIASAICFEDTVPDVVRSFFNKPKDGRQPDVVINISNDGWFHGSAEHDMHLAVSIFRAVENRVPLARAVNTGLSAIVDGNGRILQSLPKLHEGVLKARIPLDDRTSLYSSCGDWVGLCCLAVTIGLIPLGWIRKPSAASTV